MTESISSIARKNEINKDSNAEGSRGGKTDRQWNIEIFSGQNFSSVSTITAEKNIFVLNRFHLYHRSTK